VSAALIDDLDLVLFSQVSYELVSVHRSNYTLLYINVHTLVYNLSGFFDSSDSVTSSCPCLNGQKY